MIAAVKRVRTPKQEEEGAEDGAAQGARAELASLSSSCQVHSHKLVSLLGMDGVLTEAPAMRRAGRAPDWCPGRRDDVSVMH